MMTTYTHNGVTLNVHPESPYFDLDCYAVREVQQDYFWDEINPAKLRSVIDVGAHIGAYSVYLAHRNPNVQIAAIEPEQSNYDYLAQNTALKRNIHPFHAFVGYDNTLNTLVVDPSNSGGHRVIAGAGDGLHRITIEQIIDLFKWDQVDLLKIDCEGCECDVLVNMPNETFNKIERIVGERHQTYDDFWRTVGSRLDKWYSIIDQPNPINKERGVFLAVKHG